MRAIARVAHQLLTWIAVRAVKAQSSPWFLAGHALFWIVWMHSVEARPWETLTLIVSLEAIVQTSLVAMGQRLLAEEIRHAQ